MVILWSCSSKPVLPFASRLQINDILEVENKILEQNNSLNTKKPAGVIMSHLKQNQTYPSAVSQGRSSTLFQSMNLRIAEKVTQSSLGVLHNFFLFIISKVWIFLDAKKYTLLRSALASSSARRSQFAVLLATLLLPYSPERSSNRTWTVVHN